MSLPFKFLVLFLFSVLITLCLAAGDTKEESPKESNPSTTQNTPVEVDLTDCDILKQVLNDYTSLNSTITWGDHTMDCCDGEKYVCQDFMGKKFITELNLSYNYLSGSISSHFGNFTNLERLDLHNNKLTGSIPEEFKFLKNLKYLNLNSNNISGDFPEFIGQMSSLQTIDISINEISGHLPKSLNELSYLESFTARYNLISGGLTDFFSSTPNLTILDLSLNKLSGSIPKSISELYNLTELYLNDNDLDGSLPDSFVKLENLEILNLNNNHGLHGKVPDMPKYLKTCNYKDTDLCVKENAVCGLDQIPICKANTTKIVLIVVGCIAAVFLIGIIILRCIHGKRRYKEKQSDQVLLVDNEAMNNDMEEGEFIQLRENDDRHYVEVDEDYIFDSKNMNKFIN
ncbi:L domain-like protein [Neocallimastix californiae]|jgi:hypothetical protein|uniref:L domain-like protein n=1 Tax=Neocallimastix californiae TaxID=1754190 RepID=A0A1Y2BES7_9FUNG|nr:L domain-like protein [Neocallimastix californiae]|eukprot:ORY33343.1 L domain-like protein [Neocallimastix californiae]